MFLEDWISSSARLPTDCLSGRLSGQYFEGFPCRYCRPDVSHFIENGWLLLGANYAFESRTVALNALTYGFTFRMLRGYRPVRSPLLYHGLGKSKILFPPQHEHIYSMPRISGKPGSSDV